MYLRLIAGAHSPGNINAGDEFYFMIDSTSVQNCAVCLMYYPVPSKKLSIKVIPGPCQLIADVLMKPLITNRKSFSRFISENARRLAPSRNSSEARPARQEITHAVKIFLSLSTAER